MKKFCVFSVLMMALAWDFMLLKRRRLEVAFDKDLSQWRIYQSYQHTNGFNGHAPVDETGEKLPPIGHDKNLDNHFTVLVEDG